MVYFLLLKNIVWNNKVLDKIYNIEDKMFNSIYNLRMHIEKWSLNKPIEKKIKRHSLVVGNFLLYFMEWFFKACKTVPSFSCPTSAKVGAPTLAPYHFTINSDDSRRFNVLNSDPPMESTETVRPSVQDSVADSVHPIVFLVNHPRWFFGTVPLYHTPKKASVFVCQSLQLLL